MAPAETVVRGRALIASRIASAAAAVAAVPEVFDALLERPARLPRCLVATGIGTSEGHARHLAEVAARWLGQPARFASTGSLAASPPPGSEQDWLVVFSQGLSPNARHALRQVEAWGGVLLVTGLSLAPGAPPVDPEKREWLVELERRGVVRIELPCGAEYGALIRVVGARVGYAVAWSILRTLALRRLEDVGALAIAPEALARAQRDADREALRVIAQGERVGDFLGPDRMLLLVGDPGMSELCDHLALKLAEGMLRPQPRVVDVLHFAHGPLQSLATTPASILHLAAGGTQSPWAARLAASLDPAIHDLRRVRSSLALPFAAIELEAIFDAWILRQLEETETDLVAWPGAAREAALYGAGPELAAAGEAGRVNPTGSSRASARALGLEERTWPEIEALLASGRRTAIVPLGSVEQHGPHLPLATDRWIAEALAAALCDRLGDAVAVPAVAFGCASEHLDFPGTLHVEPATLEALLGDLIASLARHGFERAFVFSAHGGNADALRAMGARLVERARPLALAIEQALDVGALQATVVADHGLAATSAGPHAGEYESSVVAWLAPGTVRRSRLAPGPAIDVAAAGASLFYPSLRPHAPAGVVGDPTLARRERGPAYLGAWVDELERAYRRAFGSAASAGAASGSAPAPAGREKKRK